MKTLEYFLQLPYGTTLRKDEDKDWVAKIDELPGCTAHGETKAEALENLEEVQRVWIEDAIAAGEQVPEPTRDQGLPSGKWLQRVPRSLHKRLAEQARQEGVSLNQFITSLLAEAVGRKSASVPVVHSHEADESIWCYFTARTPKYSEWNVRAPKAKDVRILDVLSGTVASLPNQIIYPTETVTTRAKKKELDSFKA